MKDDVWKTLAWIILVFVFGMAIHFGSMTAEKIWPLDRDIDVYHHYDFNSVTQDWEER